METKRFRGFRGEIRSWKLQIHSWDSFTHNFSLSVDRRAMAWNSNSSIICSFSRSRWATGRLSDANELWENFRGESANEALLSEKMTKMILRTEGKIWCNIFKPSHFISSLLERIFFLLFLLSLYSNPHNFRWHDMSRYDGSWHKTQVMMTNHSREAKRLYFLTPNSIILWWHLIIATLGEPRGRVTLSYSRRSRGLTLECGSIAVMISCCRWRGHVRDHPKNPRSTHAQ